MLKILLKKQLTEVFRNSFYDAKKNQAKSRSSIIVSFLLFALLMIVILGGMFAAVSVGLCMGLSGNGVDWLYFALMSLMALLLGIFGSVFNTYSSLYLSKDNDLLLSMPIPVRYIIMSRLLNVYVMGLMYSGIVILPAIVIYWILGKCSFSIVIGGIALLLIISVIDLVLSCLLGWVIAKISLKLKHKSFTTAFISLVFIGAYYFVYFKAQTVIQDIIANASVYSAKIKGAAYPLYLIGRCGEGSWGAILISILTSIVLVLVTWYVLSRSFLKLATSTGAVKKTVYKEKDAKAMNSSRALLKREFSRFTSSANYMLNCGLGTLLLPISGIVLLIKSSVVTGITDSLGGVADGMLGVIVVAMLCLLASMNDPASPSVSLEGKSLWLVQSLPVTPWQVLRSKICMQLWITEIPLLFAAICAAIIVPGTIFDKIMYILTPLAFELFSAFFGLYIGLKMPNLTWTSEIKPIKQSACVAIALFGGWGIAVVMGLLFFLLCAFVPVGAYLLIVMAVLLAATYFVYRSLKTKGAAKFADL